MPGKDKRSDDGEESTGTFETLRDEGEHFVHVKQFGKAIESFTKALDMRPEDKGCLVTRSKCWLQLGNADNSLIDAEAALDQDKEFIQALFQKAEALYQKGDFENALVFYHRGHKQRSELHQFRLGIQKAQEAINNSIGAADSIKLEVKGDLSYFNKQEEAKKQQKGTYNKPKQIKREEKRDRERPKPSSDSKTVKELLGELYGDKAYLEKLLQDECMTSKRSATSQEITDRVWDGLDYLNSRADFWRQQKPMYARKRDRMQGQMKAKTRDPTSFILKSLEDIDEAQSKGRYEESLQKAKKTLTSVESMSSDDIQNQQEIIANLHSQIGNACLELGKFNQAMHHHEKDLNIAKDNDLEDAKSRALDNLGRVYARKGDYEKAVEVWEEKIPMSKSSLESAWLFHEVGRCCLEMGKFTEARDYGEKSLAAAQDAGDKSWTLHSSVLIAQSEVKLGDLQAAADSFEKSLVMAKEQSDTAAEQAIQRALSDVNDKIVQGVKDGDDKDEEDAQKRTTSRHSSVTEDEKKEDAKEYVKGAPVDEQQEQTEQTEHTEKKENPDGITD
ncbi:hypothetical protein ScPMuIL_017301 [Solemya velum]